MKREIVMKRKRVCMGEIREDLQGFRMNVRTVYNKCVEMTRGG